MGVIFVAVYDGPYWIRVGDRLWWFELDSLGCPIVLNRNGTMRKRKTGADSPFWTAVRLWVEQGKRQDKGCCVWEPEGGA
jgi:hypothetical protein